MFHRLAFQRHQNRRGVCQRKRWHGSTVLALVVATVLGLMLSLSSVPLLGGSPAGASAVGMTWTQITPTHLPSSRYNSGMAYDAKTGTVILFGGATSATTSVSDTWEWNGSDWTQLSPSHHPSARNSFSMAYDPSIQKIVLFGGYDGSFLNDTWTWDGNDWTHAATTGPSARDDASMAYDANSNQMILFGGWDGSGYPSGTWSWNGSSWSSLSPATHPDARASAVMTYDENNKNLVLFGGYIGGTGGQMFGDTWTWNGTTWANANPSTHPDARDNSSMAHDASLGEVVLFGGFNWTCDLGNCNDTWAWSGSAWTQLSPTTSPDPISDMSMAYDASSSQLFFFGGYGSSPTNEMWEFGSSTPADTTAPTTTATAKNNDNTSYTFGNWTNQSVKVTLSADDGTGSGVANTYYKLDGTQSTYSSTFTVSGEGTHSVEYWSVDNSNNEETHHTVYVKIDLTKPTITGAPTTSANGNGWYNSSVTIHWTCSDSLSGIASCPSNQTISGEGANQTVDGTATDNAGNQQQATSSPAVNIDLANPGTVISATKADNSFYAVNTWTNQSVTVTLTASDDLSGVDFTDYTVDSGQPQTYSGPFQITGEGDHKVTYWSVDKAGNTEKAKTADVMIDLTKPVTDASAKNANNTAYTFGYWTDQTVTVKLNPSDTNGSGVDRTLYKLDGANAVDYIDDFTISNEGNHTVEFWSVDLAGNSEDHQTVHVMIDKTAPETVATAKNDNDATYTFGNWTNRAITVSLWPADPLSGIDHTYYKIDGGNPMTYSDPIQITNEGVHSVVFWSVDIAGNTETSHTVSVKIDLTAPTISGTPTTNPDGNGWYDSSVTIHWTCSDALSGVATCPDDSTISAEGANQSTIGSATDVAGNEYHAASTPLVNIDLTKPVVTYSGNQGTYHLGDTINITCQASDALSGVDSTTCQDIYAPASSFHFGTTTFSASATDKAGNTGTGSVSFNVEPPSSTPRALLVAYGGSDPNVVVYLATGPFGSKPAGFLSYRDSTVTLKQVSVLSLTVNGLEAMVTGNAQLEDGTDVSFVLTVDTFSPLRPGVRLQLNTGYDSGVQDLGYARIAPTS